MDNTRITKPAWIRGKLAACEDHSRMTGLLSERGLHSVCVSAACPNKGECWKAKHVTFMILGDVCTRGCLFCNVKKGVPSSPDTAEPVNIAGAVKELGIKYAVITSVTRDDLDDKGAGHFSETVKRIKETSPGTLVELLIPDMNADAGLLERVASSGADVIGHNIELSKNLYAPVRPGADYARTLSVIGVLSGLKKKYRFALKSAMIIGLGETAGDIEATLHDLKKNGVDIVYIGQYLSPTKQHWPVKKYYTPQEFEALEASAKSMGFRAVLAGPMVRSSYRAGETYQECRNSTV